jgi:hypothetical protein
VADVLDGGVEVDPRERARDVAVLALGEELPRDVRTEPLDRVWRSIPRPDAVALVQRVIGNDLAYHDSMMDDRLAASLTSRFMALCGEEAAFFVNGELGARGFLSSWTYRARNAPPG